MIYLMYRSMSREKFRLLFPNGWAVSVFVAVAFAVAVAVLLLMVQKSSRGWAVGYFFKRRASNDASACTGEGWRRRQYRPC